MTATGLTPQDGSHRAPQEAPPLEVLSAVRPRRPGPRLTRSPGQTHTLIMYSMRLCECFSITDSIHIKGLTCRGSRDDTHTWS